MLFWTKEEYKKFSFEMMDKDVITTPKTKKSNRTIKMPHFLCEEMQEYLGMLLRPQKERPYLYSNEKLPSSRDGQRCESRRREAYPYSRPSS